MTKTLFECIYSKEAIFCSITPTRQDQGIISQYSLSFKSCSKWRKHISLKQHLSFFQMVCFRPISTLRSFSLPSPIKLGPKEIVNTSIKTMNTVMAAMEQKRHKIKILPNRNIVKSCKSYLCHVKNIHFFTYFCTLRSQAHSTLSSFAIQPSLCLYLPIYCWVILEVSEPL